MRSLVVLLVVGCGQGAAPCGTGFARADDGNCYPIASGTGGPTTPRPSTSTTTTTTAGTSGSATTCIILEWDRDQGADGTIDYSGAFFYDQDRRLERAEYDSDADGTTDQIYHYTYDAVEGWLVSEDRDDGNDGILDSTITYLWDANGLLIRREADAGADGTLDAVVAWTYDPDGNPVSRVDDNGADGVNDSTLAWQYNADGTMSEEAWDNGADGYLDRTTIFEYDTGLLITRTNHESTSVSPITNLTRLYYDSSDWLIHVVSEDGTGWVQGTTDYTNDVYGNNTLQEWDADDNGVVDTIWQRNYGAANEMTMEESDWDADGVWDDRLTQVWDCP